MFISGRRGGRGTMVIYVGARRGAGATLRVVACAPTHTMPDSAESKRFTRAEVAAHTGKDHAVFIVHNHVYNVSGFLDEHPGGHEVLLRAVGSDASEDFDDIGHSLDAKDLMKKYLIGELVDEEKTQVQQKQIWNNVSETTQDKSSDFLSSWKLPFALGMLATVLYAYLFG